MLDKNSIRAHFDADTITVYQAYNQEIANAAVANQTFVPPFKFGRITWIKPTYYHNLEMVERFSIALNLNPTLVKNNPKIIELLFSTSYEHIAA